MALLVQNDATIKTLCLLATNSVLMVVIVQTLTTTMVLIVLRKRNVLASIMIRITLLEVRLNSIAMNGKLANHIYLRVVYS